MRHIYLSPHLDDAVLSCGGAIHHHTSAGDPVQVITIFASDFEGDDLSPFARRLHAGWGGLARPMVLRQAEDRAALVYLGAEARCLEYVDAVYRTDPDGQWLYPDLETLFGELHGGDPIAQNGSQGLAERLAGLVPAGDRTRVYAPLGIGRHVDHQIVHAAARHLLKMGQQVAFYEDYPYAERAGAVEAALEATGADTWRVESFPLDPAHISAKAHAIGYHRSQIADLFVGGTEAMLSRVWAFAASRSAEACLAERIWWPPGA